VCLIIREVEMSGRDDDRAARRRGAARGAARGCLAAIVGIGLAELLQTGPVASAGVVLAVFVLGGAGIVASRHVR
jgi:hypothetical protein